jgi:hypothetical protein
MSEEAIKKRQARAKSKAIDILRQAGYEIIRSDNEKVCVIASRAAEVRIIRICVGNVTENDVDLVRYLRFPHITQACREAWCFDGKDFIIQEISVN